MKARLRILFGVILVGMLCATTWASLRVPLWNAGPDVSDPWSLATLCDAYAGFLTFYAWVFYKERAAAGRILWFILIMALGNIAMAIYVLRELARLPDDAPVEALLLRRGA